jgi:hypothetical protein
VGDAAEGKGVKQEGGKGDGCHTDVTVPSSLVDRTNHLICHLLSCPVFLAARSIPFSITLYVTWCICNLKKKTQHEYFALLIISFLLWSFPDNPVPDITGFTVF